MVDGQAQSIETVKVGDQVLGMDGQINTVEDILIHDIEDRNLYSFNGGPFFVTAEHPFMTEEGWKAIDPEMTVDKNPEFIEQHGKPSSLRVGDVLIKSEGNKVKIETLDGRNQYPKEMPVYNLRVDGNSTYYADGYLVHNK